jgi:hypothetical protein
MMAYKFYLHNEIKGFELIGVLPERRRNPVRITEESITNWIRINLAHNVKVEDIFFSVIFLEDKGK